MAFNNDKFCQFFFSNFEQSTNLEMQEIAMIGLGNVMIDFPQVKFHFYKQNMVQIISSRVRVETGQKRLLQYLWFLQILMIEPYNYDLTPQFFSDIDFLLEKHRGNLAAYRYLTKIIFQLTIEGHQHQQRIKQCLLMKNFNLILAVSNCSDIQINLQCIEILFNLTIIENSNLIENLLSYDVFPTLEMALSKINDKTRLETHFTLMNICTQNEAILRMLMDYNEGNIVRIMIQHAKIEEHDVRSIIYQSLATLAGACGPQQQAELLSMGILECLVECFNFQDVELIIQALNATARCLCFGQQFLSDTVLYGEKFDGNPVLQEIEKEFKFREILESLDMHENQQISQLAHKFIEYFYERQ